MTKKVDFEYPDLENMPRVEFDTVMEDETRWLRVTNYSPLIKDIWFTFDAEFDENAGLLSYTLIYKEGVPPDIEVQLLCEKITARLIVQFLQDILEEEKASKIDPFAEASAEAA